VSSTTTTKAPAKRGASGANLVAKARTAKASATKRTSKASQSPAATGARVRRESAKAAKAAQEQAATTLPDPGAATERPAAKRAAKASTPGLSARAIAAGNSDTAHYVAEVVRAAREAAGLSTKELAEKMATSDGAVRRIEDGRTNCTAATLANVAQALDAQVVISFGKRTR
jgi:ribosome-binding protein aMBF1 (putative translation factor)